MRPTCRPPDCTTMSRVRRSYGTRSKPKRARRLTAGTTWPREKTTPSTNGAAFGTRVTCSTISMCCTSALRSPYVVPATVNRMNVSWAEAVSDIRPSCADAAPAAGIVVDPHGALAREARERRRIENQHDAAVAEIGCPRNAVDLHQRIGD